MRNQKSTEFSLRTIIRWGIVALSVLVFLTLFFPLLSATITSSGNRLMRDIFNEILSFLPLKDGKFSFSSLALIKKVFTTDSQGYQVFWIIRALLLIPYITAIVNIVMMILNRRWSYLVTAIVSAVSVLFTLLGYLVMIPGMIGSTIDESVNNISNNSLIRSYVTTVGIAEVTSTKIRGILFRSLDFSFWYSLVLLLLIIAAALVMFFWKEREVFGDSLHEAVGSVEILTGEYVGAVIEVENGEVLMIGRNPELVQLVLTSEGIADKHCSILYSREDNCYYVTDYSVAGTTVGKKKKLIPNQTIPVKHGSILALASGFDTLKLN